MWKVPSAVRTVARRKGSVLSLPGHASERRKRFYKAVTTSPVDGRFAVQLDRRTPRSPAGQPLETPTQALADLVAAEWAAQGEDILPATMPATKLAWAALAMAEPGARDAAVDRIAAFAGSDLICYFADGPATLVERQERRWSPVIAWLEGEIGHRFHRAQGIVHRPQPEDAVAALSALARAETDFALAALAAATALLGSAILAMALRRGELTAAAAFDLSRLDESFQEERWGVDAEAAARADAMAAETVMLERWFAALA